MSIQRFDPWQPNGGIVEMVECEGAGWVRYPDHLAALTEERENLRQTLRAVERRASNAESLREDLEAALKEKETDDAAA